jgi:hypothetical protein
MLGAFHQHMQTGIMYCSALLLLWPMHSGTASSSCLSAAVSFITTTCTVNSACLQCCSARITFAASIQHTRSNRSSCSGPFCSSCCNANCCSGVQASRASDREALAIWLTLPFLDRWVRATLQPRVPSLSALACRLFFIFEVSLSARRAACVAAASSASRRSPFKTASVD